MDLKELADTQFDPASEISKVLAMLRSEYLQGKHEEGHRSAILFLSGLWTGLKLTTKPKEEDEKLHL